MPRNRNRNKNRQRIRLPTTDVESKYIPYQKRPYKETHNICQKCGRNLEFYTYSRGQLCQICRRDSINMQNEFHPPTAQSAPIYFPPRLDPAYNSFESHEEIHFQKAGHFLNREEHSYPDNWHRRIFYSDYDPKPYKSFNHFGNSQDFRHESEFQRTINYRPINDTQPSSSSYPRYSSYELPNTPSTSVSIHHKGENKRKRVPEDRSSKRIKAIPYGSTSQYDQLSKNILLYFRDNVQNAEIFSRKMALRTRLEQIIEKKFSGCGVFVFGSSMTGFATKTSDVDLSLMFFDAKIVKNRVIRLLWEIHSLLSRHHYFKKLQLIRAKVSILKFQDALSGFEVDLNINNPTGIRNSQLLRSYARLDDRVQPLVLAVKFWAREHDINNAKNGTLSSYCLGLMLIHYLQCGCNPPVLPSLQALQPDKYSPNSDLRSLDLDELLPDFMSANNENVGELFVGFLRYYSKQFDFDEKRISVRLGCVIPRVDKILNKEKELKHFIDIEEPFDLVNTARAVNNPKKAAYIKAVFHDSYNSVVLQGSLGFI